MKSTALGCVKFTRLKRKLKIPEWQVVGLLESIWLFTAKNTPQGNIGKYSNEDIAGAIEWQEDEDELINILVETGWLDVTAEYRLTVHDWHKHAPNFIKGGLAKSGLGFVGDLSELEPRVQPKDEARDIPKDGAKDTPRDTPRHTPTMPCRAKPNQTETVPSRAEPGDCQGGLPGMVPGKNCFILHRPEQAVSVKLESFDDFCKNDVTSIACAITGEKTGPGMGSFSKYLKKLALKIGDEAACERFREMLFRYWSEIKTGESPNNVGAGLILRIKTIAG